MKTKPWMWLLGLVLLLTACGQPNSLAPQAYRNWVENPENGLRTSKALNGYRFQLQYRPHDYVLLHENSGQVDDPKGWPEALKDLEGLQYYTLRIATEDGSVSPLQANLQSETEYYDRLAYLSNSIAADLSLIQGTDTLPCRLHHLERTYQMAPYSQLVLAFEDAPADGSDRQLHFRDRMFGTGVVNLRISGQALAEQPQLKIPR